MELDPKAGRIKDEKILPIVKQEIKEVEIPKETKAKT